MPHRHANEHSQHDSRRHRNGEDARWDAGRSRSYRDSVREDAGGRSNSNARELPDVRMRQRHVDDREGRAGPGHRPWRADQVGHYGRDRLPSGTFPPDERYRNEYDSRRFAVDWSHSGERARYGGDDTRSIGSDEYSYGREAEATPRGRFFGKGPKGYVRSDERIFEDVCERLRDDDEVDASEISVSVERGEVTLAGTVPDRRSKHRAEDLVGAVGGVEEVHNTLRVPRASTKVAGEGPSNAE